MARYVEVCKITVPDDFNLRGMRIVLDCAHGATYQVAPLVLRELGARVDAIGVEPERPEHQRRRRLDPSRQLLAARVRETGADLGIAFDGDGDRVLFVDGAGHGCATATTCCTCWPATGRTAAACAARWSAR